eukprot:COSAG03_NODE_14458_length_463_cov_1.546703_1_plen_99_part_01
MAQGIVLCCTLTLTLSVHKQCKLAIGGDTTRQARTMTTVGGCGGAGGLVKSTFVYVSWVRVPAPAPAHQCTIHHHYWAVGRLLPKQIGNLARLRRRVHP